MAKKLSGSCRLQSVFMSQFQGFSESILEPDFNRKITLTSIGRRKKQVLWISLCGTLLKSS